MDFTFEFKAPLEYLKSEIMQFYNLVLVDGQTQSIKLLKRIKNAHTLAFAYDDDFVIGIAALKNPEIEYKKRVFEKAGVLSIAKDYDLELGWEFTRHDYRENGVSTKLQEGLVEREKNHGIFVTTKEDNTSMHNMLEKMAFVKRGNPFKSDRGDYNLLLFTHDGQDPTSE